MNAFRVRRGSRGLVLALLASCAILGCGSSKTGPKTVKAGGKVMYKNAPVSGALVAFLGDGTIQAAQARTGPNGEFTLTTSEANDGAVPGTHQVTVIKTVAAAPASPPPTSGADSMAAAAKEAQAGKKEGADAPVHLVPEKYSKAASSGLSYTVKEGDKNYFEITLTD